MKQFLLGTGFVTSNVADLSAIPAGSLAFVEREVDGSGNLQVVSTSAPSSKELTLVLGKDTPVVLPIHTHAFDWVVEKYVAPAQFSNTITVTAPASIGDYTLIVAKKGVPFNERNKWTVTHFVGDNTKVTDAQLAAAIAKEINGNSVSSGVTASVSGAVITVTAKEVGSDYELIVADYLKDCATVGTATRGSMGRWTAAQVRDLAAKCAADAGYEYTYDEGVRTIYPGYDADPLAQPAATDNGFDVYTLTFSEPRATKTTDEAIRQVVHIACPRTSSGSASFATDLEAALDAIKG